MNRLALLGVGAGISMLLYSGAVEAAIYQGNQVVTPSDTGYAFAGTVGTGSLKLTDSGGTISATFTRGGTEQFAYSLVLFIDSVNGGIADTTQLTGNSTAGARSVSGISPGAGYSKSSVIFASGFRADYALVVNPTQQFGALYQIDSATTFHTLKNVNLSTIWPYATDFSLNLNWADINGGDSTVNSFKFQSTYLDIDGYRSLESFETLTGAIGYNTTTFGNYNVYPPTAPVPEPTNLALAVFGGVGAWAGLAQWRRTRRFKPNPQ